MQAYGSPGATQSADAKRLAHHSLPSEHHAGVKAELGTAPGWRLEFHIGVATLQAVGRRHVGPIHSTFPSSFSKMISCPAKFLGLGRRLGNTRYQLTASDNS